MADSDEQRSWTFLTSHGHVMLAISREPTLRTRDIAAQVGITERATQRIIADLERDGYISRVRDGRRNRYTVHPQGPMRHPMNDRHVLGELLDVLAGDS
ncbi:MAG: MarR family transcriptional regulator [Thermoleophilia bacterium]|nr:MarR family transcriptional regulator [Thermoleophilia bacterium]